MLNVERHPISRRTLLSHIIGGGSAAFVAACGPSIPSAEQPQQPKPAAEQQSTPPQQKLELTLTQAEQIILQEVSKDVETLDKRVTEQQLWEGLGSFRSTTRIPINESSGQESIRRIQVVLNTMQQSQNWYLQDAGTFLSQLISSGKLVFSFHPRLEEQTLEKEAIMSTGPEIYEGKIRYKMFISLEEVLNENTSLSLALFLTHEAEHIGNMIRLSQVMPASFTPEQELQSIASWKEDKEEYVKEEARGYGREALATIEAARFGLLRGWVRNSQVVQSAIFIRSEKKRMLRNGSLL